MREASWMTLLIAMAAVFVGGILFGGIGKRDLRDEASAWRRSAAESSQLIEVAQGHYRRATVELDNSREARAILETANAGLAQDLRRSKAEVRSLQELLVTIKPDTVTVTATDTLYIESGISRVDFILPFEAGTVEGYTLNPPPRASGILTLKTIPITVVTSELPDGSWQTDVTLGPPYELGSLATFTNPRKPSWWEKHDFRVGLGLGSIATLLILSAIGG